MLWLFYFHQLCIQFERNVKDLMLFYMVPILNSQRVLYICLITLCKMWWTIGNNPTLIMDLLIHYNIYTKDKCISLSQILGRRFGKHFWLFGQIPCTLSNNAYFLQWTRFWALLTIWTARNNKVFHGNLLHEVNFFKQSHRQSLFDCLQLRDITLQIYNLYFECF